jgi:hypothetical protein
MKIKTLKHFAGPIGGVPAGTVMELAYWRAAIWIAQGLAVEEE